MEHSGKDNHLLVKSEHFLSCLAPLIYFLILACIPIMPLISNYKEAKAFACFHCPINNNNALVIVERKKISGSQATLDL